MSKKTIRRGYKRRTPEERKKQVDELFQLLEEGVKNFTPDPEKFKAYLEMSALMPSYSFRNIILAKSQLPHARFLASFNRWKELNRVVKKGEKAIRVLAPRFQKVKNTDDEEEDKLIGFTSVPVFDVSQTEGDPLPIDKFRLTLEGESEEAEKIFDWVVQIADEDNCPVILKEVGSANGYYDMLKHEIVVDHNLTINHRAKTSVHELVHSRVHCLNNIKDNTTAKERECVAEGAAFIICTYFGLDTSDYSFEYVHGWANGDEEALLNYGELIQNTASGLIADFERVIACESADGPINLGGEGSINLSDEDKSLILQAI